MMNADKRGDAGDGRDNNNGDRRDNKKKKTLGRRKIPMQRIEKVESRQVTFSKRRMGLFKAAGELAVICDAQVFLVVFSPAGRPYTFGNPFVPTVVDRFLNPSGYDAETAAAAMRRIKADRDAIERQAGDLAKHLEQLEHWGKELDKAVQAAGVWIDGDVKQWELPLLEATLAALERIQAESAQRRHEMIAGFAHQAMMQQQYMGGAGDGSHVQYLGPGPSTSNGSHLQYLGPGQSTSNGSHLGQYLGPGPSTSNGSHLGQYLGLGRSTSNGTSGHEVPATGTTLKLMGVNVGYGLAPVMQTPPPPPPAVALPFINGFGYNFLGAGYGHYQGDGRVAFDGTQGVYGTNVLPLE